MKRVRVLMNILNSNSFVTNTIKFFGSLVNIQGDIESACFPVPLNIVSDLVHLFFKSFSIILVVSDERSKALISLESGDLIVKVLNLMIDKILDVLTLLSVVNSIFSIFALDVINQPCFVLLKTFLNKQKQLFLALTQLFPYVLRQSSYVVTQLHLNI